MAFILNITLTSLHLLKKRIKKNEGYSSRAYVDQLGFQTIGYGHLIRKYEKKFLTNKFSKKQLNKVFEADFKNAFQSYNKIFKTKNHKKNTKEVLIEMIFQLGAKKQKKFIKMNKHINKNNLFMAALEMKKSLWYKQTPKRVDGLIKILLKKQYEKKR